jgi:hypothetical protein
VSIEDVYGIAGRQQKVANPTTPDIDGGSFKDTKNGTYDGGVF